MANLASLMLRVHAARRLVSDGGGNCRPEVYELQGVLVRVFIFAYFLHVYILAAL